MLIMPHVLCRAHGDLPPVSPLKGSGPARDENVGLALRQRLRRGCPLNLSGRGRAPTETSVGESNTATRVSPAHFCFVKVSDACWTFLGLDPYVFFADPVSAPGRKSELFLGGSWPSAPGSSPTSRRHMRWSIHSTACKNTLAGCTCRAITSPHPTFRQKQR
ncbi:unnamed protein product [Ectocarpus sp. 4 AP-2014]